MNPRSDSHFRKASTGRVIIPKDVLIGALKLCLSSLVHSLVNVGSSLSLLLLKFLYDDSANMVEYPFSFR